MVKDKISVIIPVYNEKPTILQLIQKVKGSKYVGEIIIVDDYSTDGSRELLIKYKDPLVRVILQPSNQGKGAAVRKGLENANFDYTIVQDADFEYDPADFENLLKMVNQETKIVFGSRFLRGKPEMMSHSFWANRILTGLTNLLFGSSLTDMASCYKLIPTKTLKELKLQSNRFELELEITCKLLAKKTPIKEVPIFFKGRSYEQGKKIGWKDGIKDLILLLRYRLLGFGSNS